MLSVVEVSVLGAGDGPIPKPKTKGVTTVIIPLMEEHTLSCPVQDHALVPNATALRILRDKGEFARFAIENGLGDRCPLLYPNKEVAQFPCVLKRTDLNAGAGIEVANSPEQLVELLEQDMWRGKPYILQEFIGGKREYVTHCVCNAGRILWHCSYAYELGAGEVIRRPGIVPRYAKSTVIQLAEMEAFLLSLSYTGPCNVDHKLTDDGHTIVFEINPRLGGSLMRSENVDELRVTLSHIIQAAIANGSRASRQAL